MPSAERTIDAYMPIVDLKSRHPEWCVKVISDLPADIGEIYLPKRKTVLIARAIHDADPAYAYAHICAHLDLHNIGGPFTAKQEGEAKTLADIRLDREHHRRPELN